MGKRARQQNRARRADDQRRTDDTVAQVEALLAVLDAAEDDTPERDAAWAQLHNLAGSHVQLDAATRSAVDAAIIDSGWGDGLDAMDEEAEWRAAQTADDPE